MKSFGPYTTSIGPYYKETVDGNGMLRTAESGFIIPVVPILVVILLMYVAYRRGKEVGKKV